MVSCSEVCLFGVILIVAVSLQGCGGLTPCGEPCGEYDVGGGTVNADTKFVCLKPSEQTGGDSVCRANTDGCGWGATSGMTACTQVSASPAPAADNTEASPPVTEELSGAVPSAAITPLANLSMAFVAGALTLMAAMGLVSLLLRRRQSSAEDSDGESDEEPNVEEPIE
eukprot:gnl/MRDRNA2_/MRDRNA2_83480_c0_seq1.p1 gnl/MRDRNA2_/MRDRNA2_83480_c0~~gnl/MRDRNA2_/MRDRNA2_83480_c0_seq1.p1  ORF type:complete len:169 (+),score=28.12 gnl/MRDRNA2_/MRDRNA2_83480_c0_seq1:132-638(+)